MKKEEVMSTSLSVYLSIYNGILAKNMKEAMPVCDNMNRPREYYAMWNKSEKTNILWFQLYVQFNKNN